MLKSDFHVHTSSDPSDFWIKHSARQFIDRAAELGFEVLAITNHNRVSYDKELAEYAMQKGVLLISGIEATIERKHVILLNVLKDAEKIHTFSELEEFKKENPQIFVLAPHPFYPEANCLHKDLFKHIDLFDGIEYCHYYFRFFNRFNRKAAKFAKENRKPLIGTSDAHQFIQFNKTYTLVDADKNTGSVINALKKGRIKLITTHLSVFEGIKAIVPMFFKRVKNLFRQVKRKFYKLWFK